MSYYGVPPPRPYYPGYSAGGGYGDYNYYGNYQGGYAPPRPARGAWGGRGRGGAWSGGRGGSSVGTGSAVKTVLTSSPAAAAAKAGVKTEPAEKTVTSSGAAVKPGTVQNGSVTSAGTAAPASGQTTTTSTTGTSTTAATATTKTSTGATATAGQTTAAKTTTDGKATVDTPLSDDHPFPESVTEKFYPNRCELCSVVFPVARDIFIPEKGGLDHMMSNLQSKMHYSGKCHKKKLRQFMQDYCRKNRVMAPRKARELMKDTPALPNKTDAEEAAKVDLYCKICDLSFTSVQHALQHYSGKNHQRKVEGKPPLKSGYFNQRTGRWQRMPPGMEHMRYPSRPPVPFYGTSGTAPATTAPAAAADPSVVTVQVSPDNLVTAGGGVKPASSDGSTAATSAAATSGTGAQSKFYCQICGVSATCQVQLDSHMTGSRHKLQAKKIGLPVPAAKPATTEANSGTTATEPAAKKPRRDYSIYKTPSGKFYCLPCNLTLNSETQFAQHFESKKHQVEVTKQKKAGVAA